jgi:hypothetical protein
MNVNAFASGMKSRRSHGEADPGVGPQRQGAVCDAAGNVAAAVLMSSGGALAASPGGLLYCYLLALTEPVAGAALGAFARHGLRTVAGRLLAALISRSRTR